MKRIFAIFLLLIAFASCTQTKFVPKGSYLLSDVKVDVDNKKIGKSAVAGVLQQKPVKKVMGLPIPLWIYDLSDSTSKTRFGRWLDKTFQKIGEPPAIFDSAMFVTSVSNVKQYVKSKGYYNAVVQDTLIYKKQFVKALVKVVANEPYYVKSYTITGKDSTLLALVKSDSVGTLLRPGMVFDADVLERERERITSFLKNKGYFLFNKNYIVYEADTTIGDHEVVLTEVIKDISNYNSETSKVTLSPHEKYYVKQVNIYTNYDASEALQDKNYVDQFHSIDSDGINVRYYGKMNVTPELMTRANRIKPNELYNQRDVTRTYENLSDLRIFRSINIDFEEDSSAEVAVSDSLIHFVGDNALICNVYLTSMLSQSYKVEGELYMSSDLWGLEGKLGYTHRNLFKGAEMLNVSVNGSIDYPRSKKSENVITEVHRSSEMGINASYYIPRFLFPIDIRKYFRAYSPKTQFSLGYNYQDRSFYTRHLINFGFGYTWMINRRLSIAYNPFNFYIIKMDNADSLKNYLKDNLLMKTAFADHFISSGSVSLVYNTQDLNKQTSYYYTVLNGELAGNALSLFNPILKRKTIPDGTEAYSIWKMPYSQFAETDFTFVYNERLDSKNRLVYRFQVGVGIPYGNSTALPYEKYFYAGGANSMRGWQVRTLGPGAYRDTTRELAVGDFKLEANLEYRYKIFWAFEGALFFDVGNVWFLPSDDKPASMTFRFNTFLEQIAANTGIGLRLNLGYFIARLDMGIKMIDPSLPHGNRFIFRHFPTGDDLAFHIGIGYPF